MIIDQQQGKEVQQKDKKETNEMDNKQEQQINKKENFKVDISKPKPDYRTMILRMKTGSNGLDILEQLKYNQNDIDVVSQAFNE